MTQRWCWPTGVYYVSEVLHLLRAQAGKPGDKCTWWCVHTALRAPALFISHICKHKTCSAESPGVQPKQNKTKNKQQQQQQKRAQIGLLVLCRQFLQCFAVRVSKECTWQHHRPVWQRYFSITYSHIISVCSDLNMLNYFPLDVIASSTTPSLLDKQPKVQLALEFHRSSQGCIPKMFFFIFFIVLCI